MRDEIQPLSGAAGQNVVDSGPLVQLHIAASRTLWRIGPAWAVVAGAVAAGAPISADFLLRLAAAVILVDISWGILRRIIPDSPRPDGTATPTAPSLPYGHGDAPLARFLQTIAAGQHSGTVPWLGWLSGLVLAAALSWLLGTPVLLITISAVGLIFLARTLLRRGRYPALCLALLDVALPWVAGAALVWSVWNGDSRPWFLLIGMLAAAFTILQWGVYRARFSAGPRMVGLWLGQIMLLGTLITLRQPWAAAVAALLLLPPAWWLAQRSEIATALARSLPWWWASMLSVAAIVR